MNITLQITIFLITMLSGVCIGIYVLSQKYGSFLHRSFALLVVGLSLWGISITCLHITHNFIYSSLVFMSGSLWFVGFLFFSYSFPHGNKPPQKFYLWVLPAICIFILAPFNVFITGFHIHPDGYLEPINNLPFFIPFVVIFISYIGYSCSLVYRNYRAYKSIINYRNQFRYLFTGIGIFISSIIVFNTLLPLLGIYRLNWIGLSTAIIFFGFAAYAIVRHKLLDIRVVIQRGLIYAIVLFLLVGTYLSALMFIEYFFREATNTSTMISAGITMTFGILFLEPLKEYFRKATDPIFFKGKYDYAKALHELSKVLHTNVSEKDVISASSDLLQKIFHPTEIIFNPITNASVPIQTASVVGRTLDVPIIFEDRCICILHLGPKRSGDQYNKEDIQLLETFAYQAAVALEKGRLYEKVEEYNTHLEQLVDDRTKEIKKLQEDQKQAMIDISHNLQTPLAVITGELELLEESSQGEPEKMQVVRKSIDRVSGFIRQLLHLARLDHSIYTIELSPLNLSFLLGEQVEYFDVMGSEKGVRIISKISSSVFIKGNKRLLGELITNIVVNAITYKDTKKKSMIAVNLTSDEKNALLAITDNGIGISAEDIPELFTRFYKSARRPTTSTGTGLGLAICKTIVEKHNGTITATSTLGKKTTFVITLPLAHI